MCVHCAKNPYIVPEDYNPTVTNRNLNQLRFDGDPEYERIMNLVNDTHNTLLKLFKKESYYVGSDNKLHGYRWINVPCRVLNTFTNWAGNNRAENAVASKICEAFKFILNLNLSAMLPLNESDDRGLDNLTFSRTIKFIETYESIAAKVLGKFSREAHPQLFQLAHRVLHERTPWIRVPNSLLGENGPRAPRLRNCKDNAAGTPWQATTVWNS